MPLRFISRYLIIINVNDELQGTRSDFLVELSRSRPTTRPCGVISADARVMAIGRRRNPGPELRRGLAMRYWHESEVQMSATPSPTQLFLADSLPIASGEETPAVCQTDLENEQFPNWPRFNKRALLALTRFLITFFIGVAVALAWQSYADTTREMIAPTASLSALSLDLDGVRQSIDRIANNMATSQEQMTRSVDQLPAGH